MATQRCSADAERGSDRVHRALLFAHRDRGGELVRRDAAGPVTLAPARPGRLCSPARLRSWIRLRSNSASAPRCERHPPGSGGGVHALGQRLKTMPQPDEMSASQQQSPGL